MNLERTIVYSLYNPYILSTAGYLFVYIYIYQPIWFLAGITKDGEPSSQGIGLHRPWV